MYQQRVKRFFAYSSVHQMGYILLSLATGSFDGLFASLNYMLVYIITVISLFSLLVVSTVSLHNQNREQVDFIYLNDLSKLTKIKSSYGFFAIILFLSLANLPPFAGFFAKAFIFKALVSSSYTYVYYLAFPAIITSVISCFYYLRIVKIILFENRPIVGTIIFDFVTVLLNYAAVFFTNPRLEPSRYISLGESFVRILLVVLSTYLAVFIWVKYSFLHLVQYLTISCA